MHESSIADSLLRQVAAKVPVPAAVQRVHVRVGRLTNVSPDALNFCFEALRSEHVGEHCELIVTQPSLCASCQNCGREHEFVEWLWECPTCRSGPLIYYNGSELELEAIEIEEDGDHRSSTS